MAGINSHVQTSLVLDSHKFVTFTRTVQMAQTNGTAVSLVVACKIKLIVEFVYKLTNMNR